MSCQCWSCGRGTACDVEFCAKCEERLRVARETRRPLPVNVLLDAKHDAIHSDPGETRPARSVKVNDDLRAKAEAAKAWRPEHWCLQRTDTFPCCCVRVWGSSGCDACIGAQRAVDDIKSIIDRVMEFPPPQNCVWDERMLGLANDAARRASYFSAEPNPVSEFRDAVREECK